jgi:uncharacterized membrane protein YdbT with pleckstrin-like domain
MGYPTKLLSPGEEIITEFRPHWLQIVKEAALTVLVGVLIILVFINVDFDWAGWLVAGILIVWFVVVVTEFVRWWTTQHVVTNERVIHRAGLISKQGKEIPLEVINDVAFHQGVIERMFGSGDLLIESAGTHGQSRYTDIPRPEEIQKTIYEAREVRMSAMRGGGTVPAAATTAEQLDTLSRLHDEGKLTDEEFQAQKAKLLGGA